MLLIQRNFAPRIKVVYQLLVRLRVWWIILLAALMLSGCVRYDARINFKSPYGGEIVQHISLAESLTTLNDTQAKQWLMQIEHRTKQLRGKIQRPSSRELLISIPFYNGADLEQKFNGFFSKVIENERSDFVGFPQLQSQLQLRQNNFLLLQRNFLSWEIDLRSLGIIAPDGKLLASPDLLLKLEFALKTPWGAKKLSTLTPTQVQPLWQLQPGQLNHLEAVFWLPDPLGIGTLIVVLLVSIAGFYQRNLKLKANTSQSRVEDLTV